MITKLNRQRFNQGSVLDASSLNSVVSKINELGENLDLNFLDGTQLCSSSLNLIINSVNELSILKDLDELDFIYLDGQIVCNFNVVIDKINEIIDVINTKVNSNYELLVILKTGNNFSSLGGEFIIDAYILLNNEISNEEIEIVSPITYTLSENTYNFQIPENDNSTSYLIQLNSLYGNRKIVVNQSEKSKEEDLDENYNIYISDYTKNVTTEGGTIQFSVSILKNGINYTTKGLKSNISTPSGVSTSYTDNGIVRQYTILFSENNSFEEKNLNGTFSSDSISEEKTISIKLEASLLSNISVKISGLTSVPYYTTLLIYECYALVNGLKATDGITLEISANEVGASLISLENGTATYVINLNNTTSNKKLQLRAKYNLTYSSYITTYQNGLAKIISNDCNFTISKNSININKDSHTEIITTNGNVNSVSTSESWITATLNNNQIGISIESNTGNSNRNGTITVNGNSGCPSKTISISQTSGTTSIPDTINVLLSYEPIGSDKLVEEHKYIAGVKGEEVKFYGVRLDENGNIINDPDLFWAPNIYNTGFPGLSKKLDTTLENGNYIYTYELDDNVDTPTEIEILGMFNYHYSNNLIAEWSEDYGTYCYVEQITNDGEPVKIELGFDHYGGIDYATGLEIVGNDYHAQSGSVNLKFVKKEDGQIIPIDHFKVTNITNDGYDRTDWYSLNITADSNIPANSDGTYTITYNFTESKHTSWRAADLVLWVYFTDDTYRVMSLQLEQYPIVYLNVHSDYSRIPVYRDINYEGNVKCNGDYPAEYLDYECSEVITYYATKYLGSPINSHRGQSGTNFISDNLGTIRLVIEENNSTAKVLWIEDDLNGKARIRLKPNTTKSKLNLYFYADYVDDSGDIIVTSSILDKTYSRDSILLDFC